MCEKTTVCSYPVDWPNEAVYHRLKQVTAFCGVGRLPAWIYKQMMCFNQAGALMGVSMETSR